MSKLTEIQNCIKTLFNPDQTNLDPFNNAADQLEEYKVQWIVYLLSLLEEKDKALEEAVKALEWYGDKEVYTKNAHEPYNPVVTQIDMDLGELARTTIKNIKGSACEQCNDTGYIGSPLEFNCTPCTDCNVWWNKVRNTSSNNEGD
ncbi:hypothetical protein D3C78_1396520 [compost metagenome]